MLLRGLVGSIIVVAIVLSRDAAAQDLAKYPDWSGQWHRTGGIQWDSTKPIGAAQQPPLTPEYQARFEASLADQAAGGQGDDTTGLCMPHGMPRMMTVVFPMEIVITPKITYILTDFAAPRRIYTDARDWPKEPEENFNGYSIGKWVEPDGDGRYSTLEAETRSFKGPRTFEASGIRLHDDNQTVVKERIFRDRADSNFLFDEITTIDHALTRPWVVTKKYRREPSPNPIWVFNDCAENNRHVFLGKDSYFVSGDDLLMPTKKGQKPPDLRYFAPAGK
jgi:hypothetical protein